MKLKGGHTCHKINFPAILQYLSSNVYTLFHEYIFMIRASFEVECSLHILFASTTLLTYHFSDRENEIFSLGKGGVRPENHRVFSIPQTKINIT